MISFIDIIYQNETLDTIAYFNNHPKLNAKMPNYRVKMGFGLHLGYAIEGAIGSIFKIDASYLSPNVNMAAVLEGCTKQYNVMLLFSGDLFKMFQNPYLINYA
jgi:class 3 adenylate cyclase